MIRILVADPDSATRKALALLLRRKLGTDEIVEVDSVETLIRALADTPRTCFSSIGGCTAPPHLKPVGCFERHTPT